MIRLAMTVESLSARSRSIHCGKGWCLIPGNNAYFSEECMNIRNSLLVACLLQASFTICPAKSPITIPNEIAHQMKKGKKLDLVWAAPDFDGTKGFRLGLIANETEENIKAVQDYLPLELR